jgi:hypothetical protein
MVRAALPRLKSSGYAGLIFKQTHARSNWKVCRAGGRLLPCSEPNQDPEKRPGFVRRGGIGLDGTQPTGAGVWLGFLAERDLFPALVEQFKGAETRRECYEDITQMVVPPPPTCALSMHRRFSVCNENLTYFPGDRLDPSDLLGPPRSYAHRQGILAFCRRAAPMTTNSNAVAYDISSSSRMSSADSPMMPHSQLKVASGS